MAKDLEKFKHAVPYSFTDMDLLKEAMTHRSYAAENGLKYNNQRLEFLGDAVVNMIAAEFVFSRFPEEAEGNLSKIRSALIRQDTLAGFARALKLGEFFLGGKGELETGGAERESTLADLFEAVLGAIYLDGGLPEARRVVTTLFDNFIPDPKSLPAKLNPKGELQEYCQRKFGFTPKYSVISVSGPDHTPCFEVEVVIDDKLRARGCGSGRRNAEMGAAKRMLEEIKEKDPNLA